MNDPIVTRLSVNRGDCSRSSLLSQDIKEQSTVQPCLSRVLAFAAAIYFRTEGFRLFCHVHGTASKYQFITKVEVSLHKKNCP